MARADRYFDPVQVAQLGSVMLGLEGAEATGAGGVLLWGWAVDPAGEIQGLGCEVNGRTDPARWLDRVPRPELSEMLAGATSSSMAGVGFLALAQVDPEALRAAGGRIRLHMQTAQGSAVSANRVLFDPARSLEAGLERRLPLAQMRPAAIAEAAAAILRPELRRALGQARRDARSYTVGPPRNPSLSVVIPIEHELPVAGEYGALRQTLSYLDMDPESAALELVLVPTDDSRWASLESAVEDAATELRIVLVRPGGPLPVGAAAAVGVEAASAPRMALMSEAVVPPARGWISGAMDEEAGFAAPRAMPRFDGLVHRYRPRALTEERTVWPHDEVQARLRAATGRLGLDRWSPDLIVGERQATLDASLRAAEVVDGAGFWVALLDEAVRGGAVPLKSGERFAFVPDAAESGSGAGALLRAYALADSLERATASAGAFDEAAA